MVVKDIFVRFRTNAKQFSAAMRMPMDSFKRLHDRTGKVKKSLTILNKEGLRTGLAFRKGVQGLRGFRMEMLSLMFGGMMLQKAMFGLLKPAMTAVGIFEIWGAMLTILFLPVAMFLLNNFFLPMMEWFVSAPPWIKNTIGAFVLFLGIIGSILMLIGQLTLFMGGLTMAFPTLSGVLLGTISAFGWLVGAIVAGIAITAAFIWYVWKLWTNWRDVWDLIKSSKVAAAIATLFSPILLSIAGIVLAWRWIYDSFNENWTKITDILKPIGDFFKKWVIDPLINYWTWLIETIISLWGSISGIWEKVTGVIGKASGGILGGRQTGGYIPHDGLYKLHEGETVNQAGNSFSPNITVNATSNVDIEMLKTQLSSSWNEDLNRLSRR